MTTTIIIGCLMAFGTFQMPDVNLLNLEGVNSDSLLTLLPHTDGESKEFVLRAALVTEGTLVRVGAFYRYALDLYQLDKDLHKDRILANLKELRNELQVVGDQGACRIASRIGETQKLEVAIKQGDSEESILKIFTHLNAEIKTLAGESRPNGTNAYDFGNWIALIAVRSALYSVCDQGNTKNIMLTYVNTLVEAVEKEDSENWNAVLNALPQEDIDSELRSELFDFVTRLPHIGILSATEVDKLLADLNDVFKFFDLRFVV